MREVIQSAVNVSTSSSAVVQEIVERLAAFEGLKVADYSLDPDHNRSVVTLLGTQKALEAAVPVFFRGCRKVP